MAEEKKLVPLDLVDKIIQLGVVVPDLEKAMEGMRRILGAEPVFVKLMDYPWVEYFGERVDGKARIASYHLGIELEIMEPVGDCDVAWKDHLRDAPGPGYALHHVRFNDVDDVEEFTALMAERGIKVYQEGASVVNPGGKFVYYDTREDLGFVIEVVTTGKK